MRTFQQEENTEHDKRIGGDKGESGRCVQSEIAEYQ